MTATVRCRRGEKDTHSLFCGEAPLVWEAVGGAVKTCHISVVRYGAPAANAKP